MFMGIEAALGRLRFSPRVVFFNRRPRRSTPVRQRRYLIVQSNRGPSYEDLSRRRIERSREDRPPKALVIQLAEAIEGICLLAAVTLKLVPVCYSVYLRRQHWRQQSDETTAVFTSQSTSQSSTQSTDRERSMTVGETQGKMASSLSQLSPWSGAALMMAVVIGSLLRRFQYQPSPVMPDWTEGEREEMEGSLARAFAEIAHMASQIENLKMKVRSMRREYAHAFENADIRSDQWRRTVDEMAARVNGTESRIAEFNEVVEKMQGFASKQFLVVSAALRRIDKECKTLSAQLSAMEAPSTDPSPASEMPTAEERAELDFQS